MGETIVQQCLGILKREDIKREMKRLFRPVINIILAEMNFYIYLTIILILLIFLMNLVIFIIITHRFFKKSHIIDTILP